MNTTHSMRAGACVLALALCGCGVLGGGGTRQANTIYAPEPRMQADPAWPQVAWQLSIGRPEAARMVDSLRIAVRPVPGEVQVYKGANWAKTPSEQIEDALLRVLEDSGKAPAVARQGSGVAADYKLVMDLRRYEADYAGGASPSATIEINAKLLHARGQRIVATRTFLQAVPAGGTDVATVADAFSRALGQTATEIAGWTLATGEADRLQGARR